MAASSTTTAAVVAAAAAITGGLLTAFATRSVERMRVRAGLVEKAEERELRAIEEFLLAVNAWLDWLIYIEEQGWEGRLDVLTQRAKERDDAFRRLILLASDRLHRWLVEVYVPCEYELRRTYVHQVRWGPAVDAGGKEARRRFGELLRKDLIEQFRPEVASLRSPIETGSRLGRAIPRPVKPNSRQDDARP